MNIKCNIEGIDCANCAAVLERKISKIDGVEEASINFMMQKLNLTISGNKDDVLNNVVKVVKNEEPDVVIEEL